MFIDTHAHLFYPNFNGDIENVLSRAKESGVDYIIVPGTDIATSALAIELAEKHEEIFAAVGIHPHDTKEWDDEKLLGELKNLAKSKKVVAIGEIGLDYYYDFSPRDVQIKAFKSQLDLALELNLPVIIHNREASDDIMNLAREYNGKNLKAQFHCFGGTLLEARELIKLGYYISFTGNITFKKSDNLKDIVKHVHVDNIFLETDSPFLTPVPHRGQRNEPAYVKFVAEKIAEIKDLPIEDIARSTSYNVYRFFGIGQKPKLSFTYKIKDSLYINITNRCNADCIFCDRKGEAVVKGYNLKMEKSEEPPAEVFIDEIGDPKKYDEIVFCGFGEPTIRWDAVKKIAGYVKENGGKTRLNTDGHGSFINKRDITPELKGLIDSVSISLNSTDPKQYAELMRVDQKMFDEMIKFTKNAKKYAHVIMTIVGLNEVDSDKAKKFVTEILGVDFREREYF